MSIGLLLSISFNSLLAIKLSPSLLLLFFENTYCLFNIMLHLFIIFFKIPRIIQLSLSSLSQCQQGLMFRLVSVIEESSNSSVLQEEQMKSLHLFSTLFAQSYFSFIHSLDQTALACNRLPDLAVTSSCKGIQSTKEPRSNPKCNPVKNLNSCPTFLSTCKSA